MQFPKQPSAPSNIVVSASIRLDAKVVMEHFKVRCPPIPEGALAVLVMDYGFCKMFYHKHMGIQFMCYLTDWPKLIEGLSNYLSACKVPRINAMNLSTVVFSVSEYCDEFAATANLYDLDGGRWDVYTNRFLTYSL